MKSILQEASSVQKAIDLAWEAAGKPREFTVKVLDVGSKNFFGFSKTPAIVSLTFEPTVSASRVFKDASGRPSHGKHVTKDSAPRKSMGQTNKHTNKQPEGHENLKSYEAVKQVPVKRQNEATAIVSKELSDAAIGWTPENVTDISLFLQEVLDIMGSAVTFTTAFEKQVLTVTFARPVVDDPEAERMLYASLSYLFIQFLKKKHKKRYKGFRLIFSAQ